MNGHPVLTPLADATDPAGYGGKAAQLAGALGHALPVPGGFALAWTAVNATVAGDPDTHHGLAGLERGPWAVRSSAIGEDSAAASFAGAHLSVLGVVGSGAVLEAIGRVHASASDPSASAYRDRLSLESEDPRMAVVIQQMVAADVAGVMFTRNPVTGVRERVIEASWGLGESVVSGMVTPDQYRLGQDGRFLDRTAGEKDVALRLRPDGSVEEVAIAAEHVESFCLDEHHLTALHELATACDRAFGCTEHDIEFAFVGATPFLLQRRPITHG